MIPWAALGLIASMIEVRAVETEGVDRIDLQAIMKEVLTSVRQRGHEACWRTSSNLRGLDLPSAEACAGPGVDVVEISCFGAISRARVLLVRLDAHGAKLGEADIEVAKDDPTPLRAAVSRLIPAAPAFIAPSSPALQDAPRRTWPIAFGIGGLAASTVGAGFLAAAFATQSGIGGAQTDPVEPESIERRKGTFTWIGGGLIGLGLGAIVIYAISSD